MIAESMLEYVKVMERYGNGRSKYKLFFDLSGLSEKDCRCYNYEEQASRKDNLYVCKVITLCGQEKVAILCESCSKRQGYTIPILKELFTKESDMILKKHEG